MTDSTKRALRQQTESRRDAALKVLKPQWSRCFWTRPRGHIRDGTTGRNHYAKVCLYCGKPEMGGLDDVCQLEAYVAEAHTYPIANGVEKNQAFA